MSTHATQTSPNIPASHGTTAAMAQAKQGLAASQHQNAGLKDSQAQPAPTKKNRRRTAEKEYVAAARQRRQQQEFRNYHHPPAPEDVWICEFCEYERIFGTPPTALIRQYEIKDRRIRKQEAERRRLLEKAKMKGRKGKKGSKVSAKAASAAHDRQGSHQPVQHAPSMNQSHSQGTQSEEYYEDEYDDEYAQDDPPPPSPAAPPTLRPDIVHHGPMKHAVPTGVGGNGIPVS